MLSSKIKDLKTRKLFLKNENNRLFNKFILIHLLNNPNKTKKKYLFFFKYYKKFNQIKCKTNTRLLNKCVVSNRNNRTLSKFRLSRLIAKELMSFGVIPGYKKAIW